MVEKPLEGQMQVGVDDVAVSVHYYPTLRENVTPCSWTCPGADVAWWCGCLDVNVAVAVNAAVKVLVQIAGS